MTARMNTALESWIKTNAPSVALDHFQNMLELHIHERLLDFTNRTVRQPLLINKPAPNSYAEDVLQFMQVMGQPCLRLKAGPPPTDVLQLADNLLFGSGEGAKRGEVWEMVDAWLAYKQNQSLENLTEFVDGAIDSIYVILWTLNKLGVPADLCWQEVQRSNMAKVWPDGTVHKNELGKVEKPPGFKAPDLFGVLVEASSQATYKGGVALQGKEL